MYREEVIAKICPYLAKESQELSEGERNTLLGLLSKTVLFLNKANIVPYPDTFYRWFLTHCYLLSKGIKNPTYDALFNAYDQVDELLEKSISTDLTDSEQRRLKLYSSIVKELNRLIEQVNRVIERARKELVNRLKELLQREELSREEVEGFLKTLRSIQVEITREIEAIVSRLQGIQSRVDEIKKEISTEITECMKPNIFRAVVRRLIDRCANTGNFFTLVLIRINAWSNWSRIPEEAKVEFLNRLCSAIRSELRGYDYVTCFKEQGMLAAVIRNVGVKTAYRVIQRIEPTLSQIQLKYRGEVLETTYSFALVEGRGVLPYGKLMAKAQKVLSLCNPDETSIRSEIDLVGKC